MSRFPKLQFKFLRLLIGLPILGLGVATNFDGFWHLGYLLRCFLGLIGAYLITRMMTFELCGFGFVFIGLPLYLCTMGADSLLWLNSVWEFVGLSCASDYYPLKLTLRTLGACCIFAGLEQERR
jgi:hypothetical protein